MAREEEEWRTDFLKTNHVPERVINHVQYYCILILPVFQCRSKAQRQSKSIGIGILFWWWKLAEYYSVLFHPSHVSHDWCRFPSWKYYHTLSVCTILYTPFLSFLSFLCSPLKGLCIEVFLLLVRKHHIPRKISSSVVPHLGRRSGFRRALLTSFSTKNALLLMMVGAH